MQMSDYTYPVLTAVLVWLSKCIINIAIYCNWISLIRDLIWLISIFGKMNFVEFIQSYVFLKELIGLRWF